MILDTLMNKFVDKYPIFLEYCLLSFDFLSKIRKKPKMSEGSRRSLDQISEPAQDIWESSKIPSYILEQSDQLKVLSFPYLRRVFGLVKVRLVSDNNEYI